MGILLDAKRGRDPGPFFLSFSLAMDSDVGRTRMRASAQRDGRHAEYRWRPVLNAAKFG